jgi:hypothetical protein
MRVFVSIALLLFALSIHLSSVRSAGAEPSQGEPVFLEVGDAVQVSGTPVGCKVIVRNGGKFLDCRITGALGGSYGTLMTGRRLQVVRFRNARVAKVVFDAKQHGGFKVCR